MTTEAVPERAFHRLTANAFRFPTRQDAYHLCQRIGRPAALAHLKARLSAALKAGAPVDLNALRRTITEIEGMTEEEAAHCLSHVQPIRFYRIPPAPSPAAEKAQQERERAERKRQAQEWLDARPRDEEPDALDEVEDVDEAEDDEDILDEDALS